MTDETPIRLEDGSYQFSDGIVVSALSIQTHIATSGMTNASIQILEHITGGDVALAHAQIIHEQIVKENEEKEQARLAYEEEIEKRQQRNPNAGRRVVEEGRVIIIKDGAVLDTVLEFTDEEYTEIHYADPRTRSGCPAGKNLPVREVRLPGRYPEYLIFVRWDNGVIS